MLAPSSDLLRAGLGLKLNQVKRATRSYLRDRTDQATGTLTAYAVAAGLFAASGIFLIAACLVGAAALFRWVEIKYGMFWAFGAIGGLLLVIAGALRRRWRRAGCGDQSPHFPSLTSRLRVAIKANPFKSGQSRPARSPTGRAASDTAAAILRAPASPSSAQRFRRTAQVRRRANNREVQAGLILAATLLGWAAGAAHDTAGATNAALMSARRSEAERQSAADRGDGHRWCWRCSAIFSQPAPSPSADPSARLVADQPQPLRSPREIAQHGRGRLSRQPAFRSPGAAGRTSCGAPMCGPTRTACSRPPPAWCSSDCSRCFRRSPRWCPATACSPIPRPSAPICRRWR